MILILKTSDGKEVSVESDLLGKYSNLVKGMLDQYSLDSEKESKDKTVLPFYNISSTTVNLLMEFLKGFNQFVELKIPITFDNH